MPRKPRYGLPEVTQHIVHRGDNRLACFFTADDYPVYLEWLAGAAARFGCRIHAYTLMANHIHLLVTPTTADGVPLMMQYAGRRYVRYINRVYGRSGTLWDGRYKASLVEPGQNLLACHRYMELNPVRAGMVDAPEQYRWSSYAHHGLGIPDPVVRDHASYLALGTDPRSRKDAYAQLCRQPLSMTMLTAIRGSLNCSHVLGGAEFRARLEALLRRELGTGKPGRPRKRRSQRVYPGTRVAFEGMGPRSAPFFSEPKKLS